MAAGAMASQGAPDSAASRPPAVRLDTPSGWPVPRFVSLKSDKTYCRAGPSFAHPVRFTFMRRALPVLVVAETTDHWRKIRDSEGDECWIHRTKLSNDQTALVMQDRLTLRAQPDESAAARASLGRGLVTRIEAARGGWLRISASGLKGWAPQAALWGGQIRQGDVATHN
jgi:SH3-like domain-containing protein